MRLILVVTAAFAASALVVRGQGGPDSDVEIKITEGTQMAAVASPDRRSIAIDLLGALWVLPFDGGEAKRVTPDTLEARRPAWSPDSRALAFQGYDDGWHIYTIRVDGSAMKALTKGPFDDREPNWSRDGRRIAFSSDRFGGISSIWQVEVDSGSARQLSTYVGSEPCWTPSDREVAFWGRPADQMPLQTWIASAQDLSPPVPGPSVLVLPGGNALAPGAPTIPCASGQTFRAALPPSSRDEEFFPFRPQWLTQNESLYAADGHIKRRIRTGQAASVVPFTATLKLHRSPYVRTHRDLQPEVPQPALGIVSELASMWARSSAASWPTSSSSAAIRSATFAAPATSAASFAAGVLSTSRRFSGARRHEFLIPNS